MTFDHRKQKLLLTTENKAKSNTLNLDSKTGHFVSFTFAVERKIFPVILTMSILLSMMKKCPIINIKIFKKITFCIFLKKKNKNKNKRYTDISYPCPQGVIFKILNI